jgi:hypothetical protein
LMAVSKLVRLVVWPGPRLLCTVVMYALTVGRLHVVIVLSNAGIVSGRRAARSMPAASLAAKISRSVAVPVNSGSVKSVTVRGAVGLAVGAREASAAEASAASSRSRRWRTRSLGSVPLEAPV